jgi:N-sulfoglucosamine sulfohydrolase
MLGLRSYRKPMPSHARLSGRIVLQLHLMKSRSTLKILVASAFILTILAGAATAKPPNIVVFLSDDLGRLDTSIHGSPDARTPNLEALAASGMTFENAYVASPSCCPNRFSLLTGLMPARHGAHPNHSQPKPGTQFLLPLLKQRGYHIASFGKVAHGRNTMPGADYNSPPPRDMAANVRKHFADRKVDGPVCLLVGDRRPHVPWIQDSTYDPNRITLPPYFIDTPETRAHWARYLTDITGMDEELGRIYEFAKSRFGEDVLFLFSSDHGGQWHMGKWNLYDSGARVPLVVSWPGKIKAGVRSQAMVSWVDLLPTLLDAAGVPSPDGIDGRSFLPVLSGEAASHRDRIYTTHTGDGALNVFPIRALRFESFKLIHNLRPDAWFTNHSDRFRKDGAGAFWNSWDAAAKRDPSAKQILDRYYTRSEWEFFDLNADPRELHNQIDRQEYEAVIDVMKKELAAWIREQGDDEKAHREPYLRSQPIPEMKPTPKRRKAGK